MVAMRFISHPELCEAERFGGVFWSEGPPNPADFAFSFTAGPAVQCARVSLSRSEQKSSLVSLDILWQEGPLLSGKLPAGTQKVPSPGPLVKFLHLA